jgi:SprT protein
MLCPYESSPSPIAIQQAVMRSLREKLAQANLKLGRNYPEPKLVYQQRGSCRYGLAGVL